MIRAALAVLLLAVLTWPAAALAADRVETGTMRVAGHVREWRVFVPGTAPAGAPVVVVLHGGGDTAASMAAGSRFDLAAARHGFVAVYPQARGTRFNGGLCCSSTRGEVAVVDRLVDRAVRRFGADRRRVFAAGFSNGGFMAYRLACQRAQRFAGVAAVASTELFVPCRPQHPVSVLHVQARDETRVPFHGGRWARPGYPGSPSAFELARRWRTRNGCRPGRTTVTRSAPLTIWHTSPCRARTEVRLVVPTEGGHRWFGGEPPYGDPSDALDATTEIARFFTTLPTRRMLTPS